MVYVHLADGFEEIEALTVVDILRRAEINTVTVSIMGRKEVHGAHDIDVMADLLFEDVDYSKCQMIVLPGGGGGATNLDNHKNLVDNMKQFDSEGKWIAAICAAPMIMGHHNMYNGRKATIYKGMEAELNTLSNGEFVDNGGIYVDEKVVVDGNIITSQGPATAMLFALKLVEKLKGKETSQSLSQALLLD